MSDKVEVYKYGNTIVAHGATWAWKPGATKADYAEEYIKNPLMAERDFAANPPKSVQSALNDSSVIERNFTARPSPVDEEGAFHSWFKGDPSCEYFLHIDMSKSNDPTGMGMCHYDLISDKVVVDLIHTIDPTDQWELSFSRIEQLILTLVNLGFKFAKVSFDTWQSYQMLERLINKGLPATHYSVDRGTEAYDTLIEALLTKRLDYYPQARFIEEMKFLKLYKGNKYDHEPGRSKDTADGVAGCVAQCIKARVGLNLLGPEVDAAVHDDHILCINEHVLTTGQTVYVLDKTSPLLVGDKKRVRVMRIDAVEDQINMVLGWHDKANDRLFVDEFLVWDDYSNEYVLEHIQNFIVEVVNYLRIEAFSLNEIVPLELVNFLNTTGRRVSSPLSSRTAGYRGSNVARTSQINASVIRLCVAQLKQGNLSIPGSIPLIKDLKYTTSENQLDRIYLSSLAGWADFTSREISYGRTGHAMPKAISGIGAPLNPAQAKSPPIMGRAGRTGSADIDRIRSKYNSSYQLPQMPASNKNQNGMKSLPRPRRG